MHTPPAATIGLGASWWYRGVVVCFTIILIANYLIYTSGNPLFSSVNSTFVFTPMNVASAVALLAAVWALWDAFKPRYGALHYANGDWVLAQGDIEYQGTLCPVVDLQTYILAKFTPDSQGVRLTPEHHKREQWLHLESRHIHRSALLGATVQGAICMATANAAVTTMYWQALRRAVYAPLPPSAQPYAALASEPDAD